MQSNEWDAPNAKPQPLDVVLVRAHLAAPLASVDIVRVTVHALDSLAARADARVQRKISRGRWRVADVVPHGAWHPLQAQVAERERVDGLGKWNSDDTHKQPAIPGFNAPLTG